MSVALPAIAMVHEKHASVQCELVVQDRVEMERESVNLDFDLGFAVLPIATRAVNVTRLGTSPIYAIVKRDHRLSTFTQVDVAEIVQEPIIALPDGTFDRREMDSLFHSLSLKPKIRSIVPTIEAAARLVSTSGGVTFADELSIASLAHLNISAIRMTPTWHLDFGLFQPAHRRLSPIVADMIQAVEKRMEEIRHQRRLLEVVAPPCG